MSVSIELYIWFCFIMRVSSQLPICISYIGTGDTHCCRFPFYINKGLMFLRIRVIFKKWQSCYTYLGSTGLLLCFFYVFTCIWCIFVCINLMCEIYFFTSLDMIAGHQVRQIRHDSRSPSETIRLCPNSYFWYICSPIYLLVYLEFLLCVEYFHVI